MIVSSDFSGLTTRDDQGRLGTILNPATAGESTTISYNPDGTVLATANAGGQRTEFEYDSLHRLSKVTRGVSVNGAFTPQQIVNIVPYAGSEAIEHVEFRSVNVADPTETISYRYSDFGELQQSYAPDVGLRRFMYNAHGRMVEQLEADGSRTRISYDRADRAVLIDRDVDLTGAPQFADDVRLTWDELPAGVSCPNPGDCSAVMGRLAYVQSDSVFGSGSSALTTFYGYAGFGEVTAETLVVGTSIFRTGYIYDAAGRLVDLKFPFNTGDSAHFAYGGSGPATQHLVSRVDNFFLGNQEIEIVRAVTRSAGGGITGMWYQEQGNGAALPALASVERTYRSDGRPGTVRWRSGNNAAADLGDYTCGYYNSGQLSGISNSNPGGGGMGTSNFRYDAMGRLTCATSGDPSTTCLMDKPGLIALYTYDDRGNRTSSWWSGNAASETNTFTFDPAHPMRMQQWSRSDWPMSKPMSITYSNGGLGFGGPGQRVMEQREANGAAEPKVTRSWSYHASGTPATVQLGDNNGLTQSSYGYDHRGLRRVRIITTNGVQTGWEVYFYDLAGHLIATLRSKPDWSQAAELNYWVDNELVHRRMMEHIEWGGAPGERMYFYNDQTMTPRVGVQVNNSGTLMAGRYRASNEPFLAGAPQVDPAASGLAPVRTRFPGQVEQSGTAMQWPGGAVSNSMSNLVHNTARVYDPGYGGYAQVEPLLAYGGVSGGGGFTPWTGYAAHQPGAYVDGTGELGMLAGAAIIGGALLAQKIYMNFTGGRDGILDYIWQAPTTVVGAFIFSVGNLSLPTTQTLPSGRQILLFRGEAPGGPLGQTIGNAVCIQPDVNFENVLEHGSHHVDQHQLLGPFYLPFIAAGAANAARTSVMNPGVDLNANSGNFSEVGPYSGHAFPNGPEAGSVLFSFLPRQATTLN